jgi:glycosyltransferase involved in cell wall biosynthesis
MATVPGVELSLITPDKYSGNAYSVDLFADVQRSIEVFPVPICFGGRQGTFIYRRGELDNALNAFGPDVLLHDQEVYTFGATQMAAVARKRSIPLAFFVWENIPRTLSWPRRRLVQFALNHSDGLIAGSSAAVTVHRDWGFQGPIQVIPQMGISAVDRQPRFGRRDRDCLQIVYAGRLVPEKGVDCILRAVARLLDRKVLFHCTIIGDGPERSRLVALAETLGVGGVVTMRGSVPLEEVANQLRRSDVLVLPSRRTPVWEEQFGRILVEAMGAGTVTVGSRTGSIPEVIGTESLLFNEDDDNELADLLMSLAAEPAVFTQHQQVLWQRAKDLYQNGVLSARRVSFLNSLCEQYGIQPIL